MKNPEMLASASFTRDAAGYDDLRRYLIPCFKEFFGAALFLIKDSQSTSEIGVLKIGTGTGLFCDDDSRSVPIFVPAFTMGPRRCLNRRDGDVSRDERIDYQMADMVEADLGERDLIIWALAIPYRNGEPGQRIEQLAVLRLGQPRLWQQDR